MLTIWTQNLKTQEEKDDFTNQVLNARPVLERLSQILKDKEVALEGSERTQKAYENPNWAYLQAHRNGYYTALQNMTDLLNLDQQRDNNGLTQNYRAERPNSAR